MTPTSLKAKEFEQLILDAGKRDKRMSIVRYGVQVSMIKGEWVPIQSLPDFDGILDNGKQFIMEAKVSGSTSLGLNKAEVKPRQIKHMLKRAQMGVPCFLIIHFNEKVMVTKTHPAITVAVPVNDEDARWELLADGKPAGNLGRCEACKMGTVITWSVPPRCKKVLPDIADLFFTKTQTELCLH